MKSWVAYKWSSSGWFYWNCCGRCYKSWIGKSYQNWFLKCLLVRTILNSEVHILSLFRPSIYIKDVNPAVHLLLLISSDVNLLSSSENVIL